MDKKIYERIANSAVGIIEAWTILDCDGTAPVQFADRLAVILFCENLTRICRMYYTMGVKHERNRNHRRAVVRHQRKTIADRREGVCIADTAEAIIIQ